MNYVTSGIQRPRGGGGDRGRCRQERGIFTKQQSPRPASVLPIGQRIIGYALRETRVTLYDFRTVVVFSKL